MLESSIQKQIRKSLEKEGWIVIRPITLSENGFPDLFCFRNGRTVFIEVKRPGQKLRKIQEYQKRRLEKAGFQVLVMEDNSLEDI